MRHPSLRAEKSWYRISNFNVDLRVGYYWFSGGEEKGRAAQRYCIAFCSKITVPTYSPPPVDFPKVHFGNIYIKRDVKRKIYC